MREPTPTEIADRVEWSEPLARLDIMERRALEAMADPRWRPYRMQMHRIRAEVAPVPE